MVFLFYEHDEELSFNMPFPDNVLCFYSVVT